MSEIIHTYLAMNTAAIAEFLRQGLAVIQYICIYYSIQIGHCILISWLALILVLLLRQTVCKRHTFARGALWLLFVPVLLSGRLHFFYQTRLGVRCFYWWHVLCAEHNWVGYVCIGGILIFGLIYLIRYQRLQKYVNSLPVQELQNVKVSVCRARVTPFGTGLVRHRIVVPEQLLQSCSDEELHMILAHEQEHRRLGHLWIYALWNMMCAILWANPLLILVGKYLREDMEAVCDACTIRACDDQAYSYGHVILKAYQEIVMHRRSEDGSDGGSNDGKAHDREHGGRDYGSKDRIAEERLLRMTATLAGEQEYDSVKRRFLAIADYRSFTGRRFMAYIGGVIALSLLLIAVTKWTSYHRYTNINEGGIIFSMREWKNGGSGMAIQDYDGSVVNLYGDEIHIDGTQVQEQFPEYVSEDEPIFVYCGGYYKLPGIGGGGGFGYLDKQDVVSGDIVIEYVDSFDFWNMVFKWI